MRRFIAGAVCPRCRAEDRIVIEEVNRQGEEATAEGGGADGGREADVTRRRHCVSCGFTDTLTTGRAFEPATRFAQRPKHAAPAASVRILEPGEAGRKQRDS